MNFICYTSHPEFTVLCFHLIKFENGLGPKSAVYNWGQEYKDFVWDKRNNNMC